MSSKSMRIGISVGDTNGIGLEVILKALQNPAVYAECSPIIYASSDMLQQHAALMDIAYPEIIVLGTEKSIEKGKIYLKEIWTTHQKVEAGTATPSSGKLAFESLETVVNDLLSGDLEGIVTAPIDKKNIQNKAFQFPGHTEYLAAKSTSEEVLMLLISNGLRVGVVTGHIPLSKVASTLHTDLICEKARLVNTSLSLDFGIAKPRIAILGLNPHAGDGGLLGHEEEAIITPAIEKLSAEGIGVYGPYPADGFFGSSLYKNFDVILAMYHDQGLVPFKALSFGTGVNFTAGLPIVRTSPDHGTAFDIAGQNKADGSSFAEAVIAAVEIIKNRRRIDS
jgi:4-hydroxythreonine-4-phosphate dehydrogenase